MKKKNLTSLEEETTTFHPPKKPSNESTTLLTHPDKMMIPPDFTKKDIFTYYEQIAPFMIPYIKNHPVMMHRFPEGITKSGFFQKNAPSSLPDWIKTVEVPTKEGHNRFILCQNKKTVLYLANINCLTPHVWLSRFDHLHFPDRLIFDLDPSDNHFSKVRAVALLFKKLLDTLNLTSFVMTTGSRGLHVILPLDQSADFATVKAFALLCAAYIEQHHTDVVTLEVHKEKRGDKVFIDTARNNYAATAVAPYALRSLVGAPVATPLHWDELENNAIKTAQFCTIKTIFKRFEQQEDPWKSFMRTKQELLHAKAILNKLINKTALKS